MTYIILVNFDSIMNSPAPVTAVLKLETVLAKTLLRSFSSKKHYKVIIPSSYI